MKAFRNWKASLTWREYLSWQSRRCRLFADDALCGIVMIFVLKWLFA